MTVSFAKRFAQRDGWAFDRRPPDFICIGMAKCGTSTLYELLDQHPDISMPYKECGFFSFNWGKIPQQRYEGFMKADGTRGDCDPTYWDRNAIPRIRDLYPNAKLIVMVREPVDQIMSHVNYASIAQPDTIVGPICYERILAEGLERGISANRFLRTAYYKTAIDRIQDFDHRVFSFDDLKEDQQKFFNSLCDFIGVERTRIEPIHSNATPRPHASMSAETREAFDALLKPSTEWLAEKYGIVFK